MKNLTDLIGKNILIVDDEEDLREALAYDFLEGGATLFEADSGVDLFKKIRELHPKIPLVLLATGFADLSEPEALGLAPLLCLN